MRSRCHGLAPRLVSTPATGLVVGVVTLLLALSVSSRAHAQAFRRGDVNCNGFVSWRGGGTLDLSSAIGALNWLFVGGPPHVLGRACVWIEDCPQICPR